MGFTQLKIAVALLAVAIMVGSILGGVYFWKLIRQPEQQMLDEISKKKAGEINLPDPGKDIFREAIELVRTEDMWGAQAKLLSIMKYHPESEAVTGAKRIIGEWKMDRLLSSDPMPGKLTYEVKRGDSLNAIALRNECTVGYILRANNMTGTTIHPGEQMVVFPLTFAVVINVTDRTLTLTRDKVFFKQYDLERVRLPVGVTPPFETTISDKMAYYEDRRITLTDSKIQYAERWLQTKRTGFVIAEGGNAAKEFDAGDKPDAPDAPAGSGDTAPLEEEESFYAGVFVNRPDLEELFALLRVSTPVRVVD